MKASLYLALITMVLIFSATLKQAPLFCSSRRHQDRFDQHFPTAIETQLQPGLSTFSTMNVGLSVPLTCSLPDDYNVITTGGNTYTIRRYTFESGGMIENLEICYHTFGDLNDLKDNCIIVCHALTGNSRVDLWWSHIIGKGMALDTSRYFVVCADIIGSCYGTTGPSSVDPSSGKAYGTSFPQVTIRDTVRAHLQLLQEHLGVRRVRCVIGGSMGGMHALEWMLMANQTTHQHPAGSGSEEVQGSAEVATHQAAASSSAVYLAPYVQSAVIIGCGAQHSAWQIAFSELQRGAVAADPHWHGGNFANSPCGGSCPGPVTCLSLARQLAMVTYRSAPSYEEKFGRDQLPPSGEWKVRRYLQHQGDKFVKRMDALTYYRLTETMDTHDVTRGRIPPDLPQPAALGSCTTTGTAPSSSMPALAAVLGAVMCPVLVVSMEGDVLYPLHQQEELARHLPLAELQVLRTTHGHDGFLLEQEQLGNMIAAFLHRRGLR